MGFTRGLRRTHAAGLLTLLMSVPALVPAAGAIDADDVRITGQTIVGATLSLEAAHFFFEGCSGSWKPNHTVQWLRDGVPVSIGPPYNEYLYEVKTVDLGHRISAIATASPVNCAGRTLTTPDTDVIR